MRDLVVIEDSTIFSMLNDAAFNTTIPCLYGKKDIFTTSGGGCSSCSKKRQARKRQELANIKACLAGLSTEKRQELKTLFGAKQLRVVYTNAAGQTVQLTF